MDIFSIIKFSFTDSEKLFRMVKRKKFEEDFQYFVCVLIISSMVFAAVVIMISKISFLLSLLLPFNTNHFFFIVSGIWSFPALLLVGMVYIGFLIGSFIVSGILHISVYLLGGKKGYEKTYKAFVYAVTPLMIFLWFPLVNLVFMLWSLWLEIKGLSKFQTLSLEKAFLATLLSFILLLLLILLFF